MHNKKLILSLKYAAVAGNTIFLLWILYNGGIEEGFGGTIYQKISTIGLIGLLAVNIFLILSRQQKPLQQLIFLLRYAAICGNVVFILWILFNGINEGFKATLVEKFRYLGMILLLAINSILLIVSRTKQTAQHT